MIAKLRIREKRMENAKIRVLQLLRSSAVRSTSEQCAYPFTLLAEIAELSNEHIDENAQVVCVEIFLRFLGREEEVEDLEDKQRHAERIRTAVCDHGVSVETRRRAEKRTGSIENKDDVLPERLAISRRLLERLEDKVPVLLLSFRALDVTDSVGQYRRREKSRLRDRRWRRKESAHELLVESDDELDEAVVERLVLGVASSFDQGKEVRDEGLLERRCAWTRSVKHTGESAERTQFDGAQSLHTADFIKYRGCGYPNSLLPARFGHRRYPQLDLLDRGFLDDTSVSHAIHQNGNDLRPAFPHRAKHFGRSIGLQSGGLGEDERRSGGERVR